MHRTSAERWENFCKHSSSSLNLTLNLAHVIIGLPALDHIQRSISLRFLPHICELIKKTNDNDEFDNPSFQRSPFLRTCRWFLFLRLSILVKAWEITLNMPSEAGHRREFSFSFSIHRLEDESMQQQSCGSLSVTQRWFNFQFNYDYDADFHPSLCQVSNSPYKSPRIDMEEEGLRAIGARRHEGFIGRKWETGFNWEGKALTGFSLPGVVMWATNAASATPIQARAWSRSRVWMIPRQQSTLDCPCTQVREVLTGLQLLPRKEGRFRLPCAKRG